MKEAGLWRIAVGKLPRLIHNRMLPVAVNFKPVAAVLEGEHYLHLTGSRKLFFERDESRILLDLRAWDRLQAAGSNSFYEILAREF